MQLSTRQSIPSIYIFPQNADDSFRVAYCRNNFIYTTVGNYTNEQLSLSVIQVCLVFDGQLSPYAYGRSLMAELTRRALSATL